MSKVKTNDAAAVKAPKYVAYRLFALLLALAPVAVLCLLPIYFMVGVGGFEQKTFLAVVLDCVKAFSGEAELFVSETRLFGVLPVLFETDTICGMVTNAWIYVIALAIVLTVVFALISLFSGKAAKRLAPTIALFNFWAYGGYVVSIITTCFFLQVQFPIDLYALAIAGVSLVALVVFALVKNGAKALVNVLLLLFSCAVAGGFVYGLTVLANDGTNDLIALGDLYKYVVVGLVALAMLYAIISSIRVLTKKGWGFDIFRYVLMAVITLVLGVAFALQYFGVKLAFLAFLEEFNVNEAFWLMIVFAAAFVVSVLQVIIAAIAKAKAKKANTATDEAVAEPVVEEEPAAVAPAAQPAQAEPVAQVVAVEETVEEPEEEPEQFVPVYSVESDEEESDYVEYEDYEDEEVEYEEASEDEEEVVYEETENKATDPFIATLNKAERVQFSEVFILKTNGSLNKLPAYVVGGNNEDFFRKVFIYLGFYRNKIPAAILDKMYDFYHKNNG